MERFSLLRKLLRKILSAKQSQKPYWADLSLGLRLSVFCFVLLSIVLMPTLQGANKVYGEDVDEDRIIELVEGPLPVGGGIYETRCMICHGSKGDGEGFAGITRRVEKNGRVLKNYARDFTMGVFRFRTTPNGCLPDDEDLMKIISNGVSRSFMPSHKDDLSLEEKEAVREYIKTFSERWEEEELCDIITVEKPEWVGSAVSVKKGKRVYKEMKCWECHGDEGKGDGPKSEKIKDDWGKPILPFNFVTGELKRGSSAENVYITFTTGLDGTGMPSYEDSLNEEDRWHLVSYTLKLMGKLE